MPEKLLFRSVPPVVDDEEALLPLVALLPVVLLLPVAAVPLWPDGLSPLP